ncbi:MAG: hypothetical protein LBG59_05515 [Candidatus Peribacteria bacterium]|nr:hypothetical protein [Candidatus Peribacteria bacterium]
MLAEKSKQDKAIANFLELIASLSTTEQADNSKQEANKEKILTLVQNSTCLRNHKEMLQVVLPSGEEVEFLGDTFDNECLAALSPVFLTWYGVKLDTTAFVEEGKTYLFLHELLAQQLLLKKYVYTSLIQYPSLLSDKGERFSYQTVHTSKLFSFLNEHGPSPVRLSLLLEKKLDLQSVQEYDAFLRQIWNGVRYLVTSAKDYRKATPDQAREAFNTSADDLDRWLIGEVYDLWHRWQKAEGYQALLDTFSDIQLFVQKKLLGWYLEAKKIYLDGERDMTCYLAFSGLLNLLFPFVPGYVRAMLQALDFPMLYEFAFPPTFKKETLVQAAGAYDLFDLLYTLRLKLDIKKHQKIAIFFRADQNSLLLFQEYQDALQKVLNIEQVQLLKLHETEPTGYQQEVYNNITVGIKILPPNPSTKRPVLAELEHQYAQQLERFEHLRTVLANMSTYAFIDMETDQIKQKKAELEHVKEQLTQLEKIIQLLKVNNRRR